MWIRSNDFSNDEPIPGTNAFCVPDQDAHATFGPNQSPHLEWGDAPDGTRSFALLAIDVDVPTVGDDVNKEGIEVSYDLERTDFTHWAIVDIDPNITGFARGEHSSGVTERGKPGASGRPKEGVNDYTNWFAGDPDMEGTYKGYDGPCPPWNDARVHRYVFTLYAMDVETLSLQDDFTASDVETAAEGHILDRASLTGTYTLNQRLIG
jgi:Raf kinase inhibitor-like YbhB/YbcL family protein